METQQEEPRVSFIRSVNPEAVNFKCRQAFNGEVVETAITAQAGGGLITSASIKIGDNEAIQLCAPGHAIRPELPTEDNFAGEKARPGGLDQTPIPFGGSGQEKPSPHGFLFTRMEGIFHGSLNWSTTRWNISEIEGGIGFIMDYTPSDEIKETRFKGRDVSFKKTIRVLSDGSIEETIEINGYTRVDTGLHPYLPAPLGVRDGAGFYVERIGYIGDITDNGGIDMQFKPSDIEDKDGEVVIYPSGPTGHAIKMRVSQDPGDVPKMYNIWTERGAHYVCVEPYFGAEDDYIGFSAEQLKLLAAHTDLSIQKEVELSKLIDKLSQLDLNSGEFVSRFMRSFGHNTELRVAVFKIIERLASTQDPNVITNFENTFGVETAGKTVREVLADIYQQVFSGGPQGYNGRRNSIARNNSFSFTVRFSATN